MIDSLLPLYSYCEYDLGPLHQPLNFLSCAVFWLGAAWLAVRGGQDEEKPNFNQIAAVLLFVLGISGMVWHTTQNQWAQAVDMIGMSLLLTVIVSVLCSDIFKWGTKKGLITVVIIIFLSAWLKDSSPLLLQQHGGIFLPALFFLAMVALKIQTENEEVTVYLLSAAYLLFFGLAFRSADTYLCAYFPQGLHFLWHIMLVLSVVYMSKTLEELHNISYRTSEKMTDTDEG